MQRNKDVFVTSLDNLSNISVEQIDTVLSCSILLHSDCDNFVASDLLRRLEQIVESSKTDGSTFLFAYLSNPGNDPAIGASSEVAFSFDLALASLVGAKPNFASAVLSFLARATRRAVDISWGAAIQQAVLKLFPSLNTLEGINWYSEVKVYQKDNPRFGRFLYLEALVAWLDRIIKSEDVRVELRNRAELLVKQERELLEYILNNFRSLRLIHRDARELVGQFELVTEAEVAAAGRLESDEWGILCDTDVSDVAAIFEFSDRIFEGVS